MKLFSDLAVGTGTTWFDLEHFRNGSVVTNPANGQPVRLSLHSPDSEVMRAFETKVQQRTYDQLGRTGRLEADAKETEKLSTEKSILALADWENLPDADGNPVPFSAETARNILSNPEYRWIRDFIEDKLRRRGNFPGSADRTPKK